MRRRTRVSPDGVQSGTSSHRRSHFRGRPRSRSAGWWSGLGAVMLLVGLIGCGTNVEALVAQTGNATATMVLDLLLTDFANSVADAFDEADQPPADRGQGDGGDNGDVDGDADGDGNGDGDGDESPGAALYSANCAGCHGEDGASGFAPDITGMAADVLSAGLESASHGSISLTDEEVAELEAYLASP